MAMIKVNAACPGRLVGLILNNLLGPVIDSVPDNSCLGIHADCREELSESLSEMLPLAFCFCLGCFLIEFDCLERNDWPLMDIRVEYDEIIN